MGPILQRVFAFRELLGERFLGGPAVVKLAWVVNLQKGGTLPFVLALMVAFDHYTATAATYLAMHGSYGLIWLLKELVHPDASFQKKVTVGGALNTVLLVLGPYWLAPTLLVTQRLEQRPVVLASAAIVYALGVVLMMGSDAQKYFVLRARPGLITDGFFARVRHPNYLGEIMIYGSFAVVVGHWAPWLVLAFVWSLVFLPNMLRKEASMARHPGWAAYKARSGFLLPRVFV